MNFLNLLLFIWINFLNLRLLRNTLWMQGWTEKWTMQMDELMARQKLLQRLSNGWMDAKPEHPWGLWGRGPGPRTQRGLAPLDGPLKNKTKKKQEKRQISCPKA